MCIIVVKPKGVEFPTWKTMQNCFNNNPDGAGIMWNGADGKVHISKGFMDYSKFRKALKLIKRQLTDDSTVVMHFRIKTHGEVSKECCHPFPVEGKLDLLRELENECEFGVAHNGILSGMDTSAKKSDTMDYVMSVLYPLYKLGGKNWLHDKYARSIIENTLQGCRLAVLDGSGDMVTMGNFVEENGVLFSNGSYKERTYTPTKFWSYTDYDGYAYGTKVETVMEKAAAKNDEWIEDYIDEDALKILHENCPCEVICMEMCPDREICENGLEWYCRSEKECMAYLKDVGGWVDDDDVEFL